MFDIVDKVYRFEFNVSDLLIPGTDIVGNTTEGRQTCYLSLMKQSYRGNGFPYTDQWIIGRTIYRSHYIVYDMTPQQVDPLATYNRIGIAVKGEIRLLYDNYPITWQEPYIKVAAILISIAIVLGLIIFIFCKY